MRPCYRESATAAMYDGQDPSNGIVASDCSPASELRATRTLTHTLGSNRRSDQLADAVGHEHRERSAKYYPQDRAPLAGTAQDGTHRPGQHESDQHRQDGHGDTGADGREQNRDEWNDRAQGEGDRRRERCLPGVRQIVWVDAEFHVNVGSEGVALRQFPGYDSCGFRAESFCRVKPCQFFKFGPWHLVELLAFL